MNFVLFFCFDLGHGNHFQVARMSMISVFVCYFFLTKLFVCLFILFLLTPRSVPVVKTSSAPEVLPEIVQVDDSFSPGAVDRSCSSGGAPSRRRLFLSFSLARRPRSRRCSETPIVQVNGFFFSWCRVVLDRGRSSGGESARQCLAG